MSKGKLLAVCVVWLLILGVGVVAWKLVFSPWRDAARVRREDELAKTEAERLQDELRKGGTDSRYHRGVVNFALDSFSGYAVLRSDLFRQQLGDRGIRLELQDDGADYLARIKGLQSGDTDMAVFTIDALVKVCGQVAALPASIVALIDETSGADAIVAYRGAVPNVDALNRPETRFVVTPNSPSETLARVVMSRFDLDRLAADPFVNAQDAEDVFAHYKRGKPGEPTAYVLWEPYVSQILQNEQTHVVVDSSQFPATIVDVIVAGDDFLEKNPEVIGDLVECYLRARYRYRNASDMVSLVIEDAQRAGSPLSPQQARKLVEGIWWKNTQENLIHMDLLEGPLEPIEDMISNITDILVSTGGIQTDPTRGHPNYLYNPSVMAALRDFHPGPEDETVRNVKLPPLSDEQWEQLTTVGTFRVPKLVFGRMSDRLTGSSQLILDELAGKLATTRFYLLIRGNAGRRGDIEQNKQLAARRAKEAERYLISKGIDRNRIRAVGGEPSGETSVSFVLGQLAY